MVLCKTCEVVNGELKCVVFFLLCVVNLKGDVISIGLCNLLRGLCYNMRLGFLWKFNVVLGLCGLKKLKREGRPMGSKERDKRDLTP